MASQPQNMRLVRFGLFEADLQTHELRKGGLKIKIHDQPFQVLATLLEHPGEIVTRGELQQRIWPADTFVDFDHGLNTAVNKLREVLGDSAESPRYVETVPRRGYRFLGTCQMLGDGKLPGVAPTSVSGRQKSRIGWALGGTAVLLLAGVAVLYWLPHKPALPEVKPLTAYPGNEMRPSFSPDGNQVAFSWNGPKQDNYDIYIKIVDGGPPLRLTTNPAVDGAPAWSPSGDQIAFVRDTGEVFLISPLGGPERKLTNAKGFFLSWAPDGKAIAVSDSSSGQEPYSIFLVTIATGERRRLTYPLNGDQRSTFGDYATAFSPDGKKLAFVRRSEIGSYIYLSSLDGREPRRLSPEPISIFGLAWTPDGRELVYSANRHGRETLWRIPARASQVTEPESIPGVEGDARYPAISKPSPARPARLAYERSSQNSNIWRLELSEPSRAQRYDMSVPVRVIASTRHDEGPQFSPDGRKIAFLSDRSGRYEVWLSDRDGSNQLQLTNLPGYCGAEQWSPDGQRIAFDYLEGGNRDIYTIGVDGSALRRLTTGHSVEARPSWSHDGRWIYFRSDRSGTPQIWKMHADGGTPMQITRRGGFESFESTDGKLLYYVKPRGNSVWSVPVGGGDETTVLQPVEQGRWTVGFTGIYFIDVEAKRKIELRNDTPRSHSNIMFFNPATGKIARVGAIDETVTHGRSFSVTRDGRWALWSQIDHTDSDLVLVENFR